MCVSFILFFWKNFFREDKGGQKKGGDRERGKEAQRKMLSDECNCIRFDQPKEYRWFLLPLFFFFLSRLRLRILLHFPVCLICFNFLLAQQVIHFIDEVLRQLLFIYILNVFVIVVAFFFFFFVIFDIYLSHIQFLKGCKRKNIVTSKYINRRGRRNKAKFWRILLLLLSLLFFLTCMRLLFNLFTQFFFHYIVAFDNLYIYHFHHRNGHHQHHHQVTIASGNWLIKLESMWKSDFFFLYSVINSISIVIRLMYQEFSKLVLRQSSAALLFFPTLSNTIRTFRSVITDRLRICCQ